MLVQIVVSESVRGWEQNTCNIIDTDLQTLREFVIKDIDCDDLLEDERNEDYSDVLEYLEKNWEDYGLGLHRGCDEEEGYHFEWEESTVSYRVFNPDHEFLEMIKRNM